MVLLADVGGITGVVSTLQTLSVPEGVIADIVKVLEGESTTLEKGLVDPVVPAWFGQGGSGSELGHHTQKAHTKVSNAILEAVASLQMTGSAMMEFDKDVTRTDEDNHAATMALVARTQQAVDVLDDDQNTPATPVTTEDGRD
jgi:hypothetical protein